MSADAETLFSSAQAVIATAGSTVLSTNWFTLGSALDLAGGKGPVAEVIVTTDFAGVGAFVTFQLTACEEDGSNGVVLDTTAPIPITALVQAKAATPAGYRLTLRMRPQSALPAVSGSDPRSSLRMQYVISGADTTAGAVTAHLVPEASTEHPNKAYASGY